MINALTFYAKVINNQTEWNGTPLLTPESWSALAEVVCANPTRPQYQPYKYTPIQYGAKVQHAVEPDTSDPLTKYQDKHVQEIVGTLLCFGRYIDPTIFTALSEIASHKVKGTESVLNTYHQLLDYVSTHTNSAIQYHASDMILAIETDASYLSEHGGKSRSTEYVLLTNKNQPDFHNGDILILYGIIKHVMSSAPEAEIGALYYGFKSATPLRTTLKSPPKIILPMASPYTEWYQENQSPTTCVSGG